MNVKKHLLTALFIAAGTFAIAGAGSGKAEAASKGKYFLAGKLYYHTLSGNKVEVCGTKTTKGTLTIPAKVTYKGKKYTVTKIADHEVYDQSGDFENDGNETEISPIEGHYYRYDRADGKGIPSNVDWIAGRNITKVVLPKSLTYIGNGAFNGCSKLKTVSFAKSYKKLTIGENAFGGTKIKSIKFPKGTYELKSGAAGTIPDITIPASVKKIGGGVVNYKTKKVTIDGRNKNFKMKDGILYSRDEKVLYGASSKAPKDIVVSPDTTEIKEFAFYRTKAATVTLNANIKAIPEGAFKGAGELNEIKGTDGITDIGHGAFANCPKLAAIGNLPELNRIEKAAFWGDEKLALTISDKVSDVSDYAFSGTDYDYVTRPASVNVSSGNKKLALIEGLLVKTDGTEKTVIMQTADSEKVAVPEGVTCVAVSLGGEKCKEIMLPSTLKVQEGQLSTNAGNVTFAGRNVPKFGEDFGVNSKTTVNVPKDLLDAYKKAMNDVYEKKTDTPLFDEFGASIKGY